jgi:DNA helicase II / ATP-dependent DNA helicase PcrA
VFTDATLTAIAEREPASEADLSGIAGVGVRKLGMYGAQVLHVLRGATAEEALDSASVAPHSPE